MVVTAQSPCSTGCGGGVVVTGSVGSSEPPVDGVVVVGDVLPPVEGVVVVGEVGSPVDGVVVVGDVPPPVEGAVVVVGEVGSPVDGAVVVVGDVLPPVEGVVVVVGEVVPPVDGAVVVGEVDPPVDGAVVVVGDVPPPLAGAVVVGEVEPPVDGAVVVGGVVVEPVSVTFKYTTWASSRMFPSGSRISDTRAYSPAGTFRSKSRATPLARSGAARSGMFGSAPVWSDTNWPREPIESLRSTVNPSTAAIWPLTRVAIDRRRWVGLLTPSAATTAVSDPSVSARS